VLVENGVAAKTDVAQVMARLFVTQTFDPPFAREPIAARVWIVEAQKTFAQAHPAVCAQVVARDDDVAGARVRVTMHAAERVRQLFLRAFREQSAHRFDGTQTHARRCSRRKDAIDQLFPQALVRAFAPHLLKLREALSDVRRTRPMCRMKVFDGNGLLVSTHLVATEEGTLAGLSIARGDQRLEF
jgi:hypothetical protein